MPPFFLRKAQVLQPRVRPPGETQTGIVLVILQINIVARPVLLDQVALEDQRFHFGIGDHIFEIAHLGADRLQPRRNSAAVGDVVLDALPQRPGFTDIDHPPHGILDQINTG